MDHEMRKMRAARDASSEASRPKTPLYLPLEALRGYRELSTRWDDLLQVAGETSRDLQALLAMQTEESEPWVEVCQESHEILKDFLLDPRPELLDPLEVHLESLQLAFLEHDLGACYRGLELSHHWTRLHDLLDTEVEEGLLVEGYFRTLEGTLERWLQDEIDSESVRQTLEEHLARVERQIQEYDSSYLAPEEWTVEVALADHLLTEGLADWREGLVLLLSCVLRAERSLGPGLECLLNGNRKLIQVDRLNNLT